MKVELGREYLPEVDTLQREYAGNVLRLRGFLPNGGAATPPRQQVFDLAEYQVREGNTVAVVGCFETAPVAAYICSMPLTIHAARNDVRSVDITLTIPVGTRSGRVRLVWPTKAILSERELRVMREPALKEFTLIQNRALPGTWLRVGRFEEEPVAVIVGGCPVCPEDVFWEAAEGLLRVRVPIDAGAGPVTVVTRGPAYHSDGPFSAN